MRDRFERRALEEDGGIGTVFALPSIREHFLSAHSTCEKPRIMIKKSSRSLFSVLIAREPLGILIEP